MKAITTFAEMVAYLESFTNLERQVDNYTVRTYRLDRMEKLLAHLGNPEQSFRTIHLAGSKGKGSTASYLAAALSANGEKTGLFLSPHLRDYRERFTLAGEFFSDAVLIEVGNHLQTSLTSFSFSDEWGAALPTTFELFCAYAYLLFAHAGCTWAVIETGLGGRLDATNTLAPVASLITPIEIEHTRILGSTLAEIATEKSKIIKTNTPLFISYQQPEVMEILLAEAAHKGAPVYRLDEALFALDSTTGEAGERVHYLWNDGRSETLLLEMRGSVQALNSALALLVLRTLDLATPATPSAISKNRLPGRFQQISSTPATFVDGAHTTESLSQLLNSFSSLYPKERTTIIYGALLDKEHESMVRSVLDHSNHVIISRPGTYKESDIQSLHTLFMSLKAPEQVVELVEDNTEALKRAQAVTDEAGAILVCGSFYLAGGIADILASKERGDEFKLA
ncbi:MAG TPA: cyanophycin synthetase [Sphaerochaeta sp.]|nr:cyanophycin synthetase [Sphaerochaeta sp.]